MFAYLWRLLVEGGTWAWSGKKPFLAGSASLLDSVERQDVTETTKLGLFGFNPMKLFMSLILIVSGLGGLGLVIFLHRES